MRRAFAVLVASGALASVVAGCAPERRADVLPPAVDVDTAELREVKRRIGMADCEPGTGDGPVEGGLPELVLPCLGGGPEVELAALRGPMVINLWASWCTPCIEEMPALQAFHERHGDRVAVLGVDYQDVRPGGALELAERTGATYPSLADPGGELHGVEGFGRITGLPGWLFVDSDGAVTHVEYRPVDSLADIEAMVIEHLGVRL